MSVGDRKYFDTKLDRWMAASGVRPAHVAQGSEYSRQHLLRIRKGEMEPTRRCIKAITATCRSFGGAGQGVRSVRLGGLMGLLLSAKSNLGRFVAKAGRVGYF